jgi:hypothetical protein
MTLAMRTVVWAAAGLFAGSLQAQPPGKEGTPYFTARSGGEMETQRTAELLAATQQRNIEPRMSTMHRLDEHFTLTRQSQGEPMMFAKADTAVPPPAGYGSGYASVPAVSYASAPAPAYASSPSYATGVSSAAIPAMPDARPGECFALVKVPEKFRTYQKEYELRAASERLETIPPRYETVTEQYVVQEAHERLETIPATFRNVTEQVEVAPASVRYVSSEPVYETVSEQVLEQPARTVWKRGSGPIQRIDNATGEIMCLVEEPAIYKTVTRRVLKAPAEAREVPVPAQYSTITRRVIDRPAEVRRVVIPEQVGTRTVRKLVEPGGVRRIPIPSQMGTTTVRELVEPARLEWRSVLCETNMTPQNIQRVQEALQREGYNPGPIDGRLNVQTLNALNQYQRARSLPEDRYLNMDTVHALGVL